MLCVWIGWITMTCSNCRILTGRTIAHTDGKCPQVDSFLCRRCHCRGHLTRNCPEERYPQWERPTTLEELISPDLRARYGIQTITPFQSWHSLKRGEKTDEHDTLVELNTINEILIPREFKKLSEFAKERGIVVVTQTTKPSTEGLVDSIIDWGRERGYRILIQ